jgi:aspartate-semialdehyde dehydrogenase
VITTFEPVSGAGHAGIEELQRQTLNLMSGQSTENQVFPQRIAFNLLPQLGEPLAGGSTRDEAATDVHQALRSAPGLLLTEEIEAQSYVTPADAIGEDATYVGRVRCNEDSTRVDLWIAIDNIRKGSAVNAIQIAELLLRDYL